MKTAQQIIEAMRERESVVKEIFEASAKQCEIYPLGSAEKSVCVQSCLTESFAEVRFQEMMELLREIESHLFALVDRG